MTGFATDNSCGW